VTSVALHADQVFFRVPGGIGTYVRELVPALARNDPDLRIQLFHAAAPRPGEGDWLGHFEVRRLRRGIRSLYPAWNLLGRPALPAGLAGMDVLHAPSPAAVPPPGSRQRLVVTVHDLAFRLLPALFPPVWRTLFRAGLRRAVRKADALITVSEHTARDLVLHTRARPERVHVTPLAATLPRTEEDPGPTLRRLGIPAPYVLFVGTLEPRKNLVRLVRAYRRLVATTDLPHALVLAGPPGWDPQPLRGELALPGGRVVTTGALGSAELDAVYRGADAFCYPSLYEGFGLPVLEAMARGVPCVVSATSSLPEVAGDAAIQVEPRSTSDIARALGRVLTDPPQAARLREAGRARASRYSWDRTADATLRVYRGGA
jgi:glycosyltransferase involved in cell wall biosynthesis